MKIAAIIVNFFIPGVGSFLVGKVAIGIVQLILFIVGVLLTMTGLLAIIGIPLSLGAWIWGLVTAATSPSQPIQVTVVHQHGPAPGQQQQTVAHKR